MRREKHWPGAALILAALILAGAPSQEAAAEEWAPAGAKYAPEGAEYTPEGDVVLGEMESVRFLQGEQTFGRIQLKPYDDPELEIVVGPADRPRGRTVSWWEAQAYDGRGTGIWMASSSEGFPGGISVYVDNKTRVFVNEHGLMIRDAHQLYFGDEWHYLARCGDDLCWHKPGGVVNLTSTDGQD